MTIGIVRPHEVRARIRCKAIQSALVYDQLVTGREGVDEYLPEFRSVRSLASTCTWPSARQSGPGNVRVQDINAPRDGHMAATSLQLFEFLRSGKMKKTISKNTIMALRRKTWERGSFESCGEVAHPA